MPRCRAVSHHFPDRRFDQIGRPLPGETAPDLFDAGNFSSGPDLLQSGSNVGKGRKALSSGMQVDQIVMALFLYFAKLLGSSAHLVQLGD
jgi:hypothetical protein